MYSQIKQNEKTLSDRIEHLILKFDDHPHDLDCFHLNYSDTTYNQKEFARVLFESLPLFALSPEEYNKLRSDSPSELLRQAFDNITKNDTMSDYGEALLFVILDYFFEVPKFVTKVRLRTAEKVPVFGFDCAHVSFEDDEVCLWLGEAKLRDSFSGAVSDALESVNKFLELDELNTQVRLLRTHLEVNKSVDPTLYDKLEKITNQIIPIGQFKIRVPILLANNSIAAKDSQSLQELKDSLADELTSRMKTISSKNWPSIQNLSFDFIIFPLADKEALIEDLSGYKS